MSQQCLCKTCSSNTGLGSTGGRVTCRSPELLFPLSEVPAEGTDINFGGLLTSACCFHCRLSSHEERHWIGRDTQKLLQLEFWDGSTSDVPQGLCLRELRGEMYYVISPPPIKIIFKIAIGFSLILLLSELKSLRKILVMPLLISSLNYF